MTRDGLLVLLALAALARALVGRAPDDGDTRTAGETLVLVAALSALTLIPVPGA